MHKNFLLIYFYIVSLFLCNQNLLGQQPTSPSDIQDIKELVKKEDFESLSRFLTANDIKIIKSNLNYNHGSYYVIADIECEKKLPSYKSKPGKYHDEIENIEKIIIEYHEEDDYKKLTISQQYWTIESEFFGYFADWRQMNWTYVCLGERNNILEIDNGMNLPFWDNNLKSVSKDKIDLKSHMIWNGNLGHPFSIYKKIYFRNLNENLGTRRNYSCQLSSPISNSEYNLYLADTAYYFSLKMEDYYPKFFKEDNTTSANFKSINLIKSGKTYYVNISIGGKKKKYVLDSGASDVTIDESTYKQLRQSGIIKVKHKLPDGEYQIADGSSKTYRRTLLPEISIGTLKIIDVVTTIVPDGQPLLLGKSFLDNFKTWKIDNSKNILIIEVQ